MFQIIMLILVGIALVAGGLWLSANPGSLTVDWLGWQIDTNMIFGLIGLVVLFVAFLVVLRIIGIVASMLGLRGFKTLGNLRRAAEAMGESYAALRGGNGAEAQVEAHRARAAYHDPANSPAALMEADGYAMAGNAAAARELYMVLLGNPKTEIAALRGLLDLAVAERDDEGIQEWSERALFKADNPDWAALPALDLMRRQGRMDQAERPLQVLESTGAMLPERARQLRAEAFLARATAAKGAGKASEAQTLCRQALDLAPDFPEAADMLARMYAAEHKDRKAAQVVEEIWRRQPHPLLARTWRDLSGKSEPMVAANRMQTLAGFNPDHPESRLAAAEANIDAKLWGPARAQLEPLLGQDEPCVRTCLLMARIEEGESGDTAKVMAWMNKAVAASQGLAAAAVADSEGTAKAA
jgi:HemY protein